MNLGKELPLAILAFALGCGGRVDSTGSGDASGIAYGSSSSGGASNSSGGSSSSTSGSSGTGASSGGSGGREGGLDAASGDSSIGDASVCAHNATQCLGNGVQTCGSNGRWGSVAACTNQACASGACTGVCTPGTQGCAEGTGVQTCGANGQWDNPWPCTTGTCSGGACTGSTTTGTSCQVSGPGLTNCGSGTESCCTSLEVTGGTYYRTYTNSGSGPKGEADPATVSGFRLDKYLVTVGRFRQFVTAWNNGAGYTPPAGSGKHTHLNGGRGLANSGTAGTYEPGWATSNNGNVAPTNANLVNCGSSSADAYATWTSSSGSQENLPIYCVNWWEAYAFCIWDGGFLPSEAEWEYAAAGGSQQREYPWGTTAPGTANQYAIYGCYYPSGSGRCAGVTSIAPVGTATLGAGLWGQLDLAGEMWEWNLERIRQPVDV
jgi:sulfatase modifying factor 1